MKKDAVISFDAVVERIAPEVPRFVVYPGKAWDETETFVVEVRLNGIDIGAEVDARENAVLARYVVFVAAD